MGETTTNSRRICLQEIVETEQYYFLNDNDLKLQFKLLDLLPRIDLNITSNPISCSQCMNIVEEIYEFKQLCMQTETTVRNLQQTIPLNNVLINVKEETIKEELVDNIKVELSDLQFINDDFLEINTDGLTCIKEPSETRSNYCQLYSLTHTNKKTNEKETLIYHVIEPCVCDTCGYSTQCKNSLKKHMRTHSSVKQFICETCEVSFPSGWKLKRHMITHNSMKSFICETCGLSTRYEINLKRHMLKHSLIKSFVCETCGFSFQSRKKLKYHRRTHSPVKLFVCETCKNSFQVTGS